MTPVVTVTLAWPGEEPQTFEGHMPEGLPAELAPLEAEVALLGATDLAREALERRRVTAVQFAEAVSGL